MKTRRKLYESHRVLPCINHVWIIYFFLNLQGKLKKNFIYPNKGKIMNIHIWFSTTSGSLWKSLCKENKHSQSNLTLRCKTTKQKDKEIIFVILNMERKNIILHFILFMVCLDESNAAGSKYISYHLYFPTYTISPKMQIFERKI